MKTPRIAMPLLAAMLTAAAGTAGADAFHTPVTTPGTVGYAKSLSSTLTLRADLASWPGVARDSIEEGVSYTGHVKSDRAALFMDWYLAGHLRLTGGMTFNRTRVDLRAGGHAGAPMAGDVPYSTAANDRFDITMRAPQASPYLGVGFGHYSAGGSSLLFDVGGSFGRSGATDVPGMLAALPSSALDGEAAQLRDGIGRVRFVPQVSLGMNLKF